MPSGHSYVFFGEMSIQVFCPVFGLVVGFFGFFEFFFFFFFLADELYSACFLMRLLLPQEGKDENTVMLGRPATAQYEE